MDSETRVIGEDHLAEPGTIQLRAKHDAAVVVQALTKEKANLDKLGKKLADEGYGRESRVLLSDAAAIEHAILPAMRGQAELTLVTSADLDKAVRGAVRKAVMRAFDGLGDPKVTLTYDGAVFRRDTLLDSLAAQIVAFAIDLSAAAFDQGLAARLATPEALALRAIDTLRAAAPQ